MQDITDKVNSFEDIKPGMAFIDDERGLIFLVVSINYELQSLNIRVFEHKNGLCRDITKSYATNSDGLAPFAFITLRKWCRIYKLAADDVLQLLI